MNLLFLAAGSSVWSAAARPVTRATVILSTFRVFRDFSDGRDQRDFSVFRDFCVFRRFHVFCLLCVFCVLCTFGIFSGSQASNNVESYSGPTYTRLFEELSRLALSGEAAPVQGFIFEREQATFSLDDGLLFRCTETMGRHGFFLFEGSGRFAYKPALKVEQDQLARLRGAPVSEETFQRALFFFADQSPTQLANALPFGPMEATTTADKFLRNARKYLPEPGITEVLLCGENNDLFYAHIQGENELCYQVDPYSAEEVSLSEDRTKFHEIWSPITRHHRSTDYSLGRQEDYESHERTWITHYDLETSISTGLDIEVTADLHLEGEARPWLRFFLHPELEITQASWSNGEPLEFGREEDSWIVWVATPEEWAAPHQLQISYDGDIITRDGDWIRLDSSIGWYPKIDWRRHATFDLHYDVPDRFTFLSVGDPVEEAVEDGRRKLHYQLLQPSRNATFNVGHLELYEIQDERIPPLSVYYSEKHHRDIAQALIEEGTLSGKDMHKQVAADVANALAFYHELYGPCPASELIAVETPTGHGEAFPGLINLSWATFQLTGRDKAPEQFRAHEVAHQWWGASGVDFASYHDQWLSEAFAEYSAAWFVQAGLGDNEAFFDRLRDWRDDIFDNRNYLIGEGTEAGPIWLGYRTDTADTRGDYDLIVYRKGAWVLHMLRNLLMDLNTLDDSKFRDLLRGFFETHKGGKASTSDFLAACEQAAGTSMGWFFHQWIFGTELPQYRFAWTSAPSDDGTHVVSMRVSQEDVAEDFRAYVPIRVDLEGGGAVRLRVHLVGPVSEFDLPPLPADPKSIVFNEFESVLCRHDEVEWQ